MLISSLWRRTRKTLPISYLLAQELDGLESRSPARLPRAVQSCALNRSRRIRGASSALASTHLICSVRLHAVIVRGETKRPDLRGAADRSRQRDLIVEFACDVNVDVDSTRSLPVFVLVVTRLFMGCGSAQVACVSIKR